jgi:hypothetical protein
VTRIEASVLVPGRVSDAEGLWYDVGRWPNFVDGFAAIVQRDDDWPASGTVIWDSTPHGRGRVLERVSHHEQRAGQTAEVEDERLEGIQRIAFRPEGGDTRVTLSLDYRLKERNLLTPIIDFLFVRRAVGDALRRTVSRFAQERRGDAEVT